MRRGTRSAAHARTRGRARGRRAVAPPPPRAGGRRARARLAFDFEQGRRGLVELAAGRAQPVPLDAGEQRVAQHVQTGGGRVERRRRFPAGECALRRRPGAAATASTSIQVAWPSSSLSCARPSSMPAGSACRRRESSAVSSVSGDAFDASGQSASINSSRATARRRLRTRKASAIRPWRLGRPASSRRSPTRSSSGPHSRIVTGSTPGI